MSEKISKDFAKQLSHDLKAPLSALKVIKDMLENDDQKDLLVASIDRFEEIIARIEKEKTAPDNCG